MSVRQRLECFTNDDYLNNYLLNNYSLKILSSLDINSIINYININHNKAYLISDIYGNILNANNKWCTIYGYNYDELIGKNCNILNGDETDKNIIKKFNEELKNNGKSVMNIINYNVNNEKINCIIKAIQLNNLNELLLLSNNRYFISEFILK